MLEEANGQTVALLTNPAAFTSCRALLSGLTGSHLCFRGFPRGLDGKESACDAGDLGSVPGSV